jgi:hypothetical protein
MADERYKLNRLLSKIIDVLLLKNIKRILYHYIKIKKKIMCII